MATSRPRPATPPATSARLRPLSDAERDRLEALLEALPPPLEPLDLSALDGFLVGVLLQPQTVPPSRWLRHIHDLDGRAAPKGVALDEIHALVQRRHAELDHAIVGRLWFDPWVFELEAARPGELASPSESVLPWVAGLAAALEQFPALLQIEHDELREPLAVLYAHFEADDLEDVDDLRSLIDEIAPPDDLEEAVQDLVRCTLLLADVSRPRPAPGARRPSSR